VVFDDGRTISLAGGAVPVRDQNGRVRGAVAAMGDVSAQKRAEELSAAARAEAEKAAETLRRVQRITDAMLGDLPPDELLHEVLLRVQEALRVDVAILLVGEVDKHKGLVLRYRTIIGLPGIEIGAVAVRGGFGAAVATERRAKVWNDVDSEQVLVPLLQHVGMRSVAGVPLMLGEHLLGVLEVASVQPGNFAEEDVNLLRLA